MKKSSAVSLFRCVAAILLVVLPLLATGSHAKVGSPNATPVPPINAVYGLLPLSFEANNGQTDSRVKFLSRGGESTVFLTATEAVIVVSKRHHRATSDRFLVRKTDLPPLRSVTRAVVRMKLVGAEAEPQLTGLDELPGKANYFIGNDPAKWRRNVPTYAKVQYKDVYRGIDLVYYGNQRQLEYDFVVAPHADPGQILVAFEGPDRLEVDGHGDLVLHTAAGAIRQRKPSVYQMFDGMRREIAGVYVLKGPQRVGIQVAAYDAGRPLVIDPVLSYSTYVGGSDADQAQAIALDAAGNAYVTGFTRSPDFPTTAGAFQTSFPANDDAFVVKLNAGGSAFIYATYLGGSGLDGGNGIAVDAAGNAYVAGFTNSTDFPTSAVPLDSGPGGGFVTKLDPSGAALVYSTYLRGFGAWIAVDSAGNAFATGSTNAPDFPTTPGAYKRTFSGNVTGFVTKLNSTGSAYVYSTYLGGSTLDGGNALALDASGNAYVTGFTSSTDFPTTPGVLQPTAPGATNGFVTKLNAAGTALIFSTYLGGSGNSQPLGIAVDGVGNVYLTGVTDASDFPTTPGAFQPTFGASGGFSQAFVMKLNSLGSGMIYSTFLGGTGYAWGFGIAIDASGNAYVTGETFSADFPTTAAAFQTSLSTANLSDVFLTKFDPTGASLIYSTYLGGSSDDRGRSIALDAAGNAYVTGHAGPVDFPITPGAAQTTGTGQNAFVAKISSNTPSGANVAVSAGNGTTVTFTAVLSPGETSAPTSTSGPTPPAGFSLASSYYEITTTATFVSPVTVCMSYVPGQFGDPTTLRLFHFENSAWVDVTTSNNTLAGTICGQVSSFSPFIVGQHGRPLTALGPANLWVGLKNSDDVGIRFDLRVEVYRNGTQLVGAGEVASVAGGSSGFNNANQQTINLTPVAGANYLSGDQLSIKVLVRNACTGSGKNSGTARLWYNDTSANSRFNATIGSPATYYLASGSTLSTAPGSGPKLTSDVAAGAKCSPYKTFGTWSKTLN